MLVKENKMKQYVKIGLVTMLLISTKLAFGQTVALLTPSDMSKSVSVSVTVAKKARIEVLRASNLINIDNESIAEFRIDDSPNSFNKLYANRLDVSKGNKKQVMVYWFMFKKFGINDAVSMIRISSPVTYNENSTYETIKIFVESELFNAMYRRNEIEDITMAEYIIEKYGRAGMTALILSVSVPIGLVFIGLRRKN